MSYEEALERVRQFLKQRDYNYRESGEANCTRFDVSNLREKTIVKVYSSGKLVVQGSANTLKTEFESLKTEWQSGLDESLNALTHKYYLPSPETQMVVKELLETGPWTCTIENEVTNSVSSRLRLARGKEKLTITQFCTGTLMLQGRADSLFHDCCDLVEKGAKLPQELILERLIAAAGGDSTSHHPGKEDFNLAVSNARQVLGSAFDYLYTHDQKLMVCAHCLVLARLQMPDYSPVVMPASKALEGFIKRLIVDISLVPEDHFSKTSANFSIMADSTNPKRVELCMRDKNMNKYLLRLNTDLAFYRHHMMHSDNNVLARVDTHKEASDKVQAISHIMSEAFRYFREICGIGGVL